MDNDDFRRSRPTLHRLMGEAPALLLGDALLCGAFEVLSLPPFHAFHTQRLVRELSLAASGSQLVGGQFDDLIFEKQKIPFSSESLMSIHRRKTGALFGAAVSMAYILAHKDKFEEHKLSVYREWGIKLGVIFQHIDDLLDNGLLLKELGETRLRERCEELSQELVNESSSFWENNRTQSLLNYFLLRHQ
jgi:geranylgeranyl diphosphate synthase type II